MCIKAEGRKQTEHIYTPQTMETSVKGREREMEWERKSCVFINQLMTPLQWPL